MNGLFITFEGIDGTGKSTQICKIAELYRKKGKEIVLTREPGGTVLAEKLRDLILDQNIKLSNRTQSLMFMAGRSEHVEQVIRPAVTAGKWVFCDRFCDSTYVYQGLTQGLEIEELSELRHLNLLATGGLMPNLTILLDAQPEDLLLRRQERGVKDRFENSGLKFQKELRNGFLKLAKIEPLRIKVVNALGSEEEVHKKIVIEIEKFLANFLSKYE